MRPARIFILLLVALAGTGCARRVYVAPYAQPAGVDAAVYGQAQTFLPRPNYNSRLIVGPPPPVYMPTPGPAVMAASAGAATEAPYTLDAGDKLRVVVFGQDGLTNSYSVDAGGNISMPLIGSVHARGLTTARLAEEIAAKLRQGYVREPHVAVEIETYRPFFILGEVTYPGQYPFVANMTVETAVAIAGGFTPRAKRDVVNLSRAYQGQVIRSPAATTTAVRPGDTIVVGERWF